MKCGSNLIQHETAPVRIQISKTNKLFGTQHLVTRQYLPILITGVDHFAQTQGSALQRSMHACVPENVWGDDEDDVLVARLWSELNQHCFSGS